jgi:hypothetical protein
VLQLLDRRVGEVAVGRELESSRRDPVDEFAGDLSQRVPAREGVVCAGQPIVAGQARDDGRERRTILLAVRSLDERPEFIRAETVLGRSSPRVLAPLLAVDAFTRLSAPRVAR